MVTLVQIIVTPGSGAGRAILLARDVRRCLEQRGYTAVIQAFRTLGDLMVWTKTCRASFSHLVAIGGDATLSAAAEAAVRLTIPLVPVPSGFGNLFSAAFEHPSDPDEIAALLGQGDLVWADVGVVRGEMFLSHQSYGYLARIQEDVERLERPRQRYLRLLSYYRTAAKQLTGGSLDSIGLEIDGRAVPGKAGLVTIANVETYRGFLSLTPAASPADGVFDVCVIPRTTQARVLAQLVKVMLDVPGCRDEISVYRGRHVRVRVNRRKPEHVRILDGVLPLLTPAGSLDRLQARQFAAQAELPVVTPGPRAPGASELAPAAERRLRVRSTPPGVVA